jgi:hypothetical protein
MKTKKIYLFGVMLFVSFYQVDAQDKPAAAPTATSSKDGHALNFIKINLTGIALKNYSIQYERVTGKKTSVGATFRSMPNSFLPFKSQLLDIVDNTDTTTRNAINTFKMSNFAFTPEFRFYIGKKGYGRGFYIAIFYRYAGFKTDNFIVEYKDNMNVKNNINLTGKLTTNTGGIMLGTQWLLGKHLCLDWWILGPHYGTGKGDFNGVSNKPLSASDQADLKKQLNDLDIPFTDKTVNVTANGASLQLGGPWAGIRAGISFGVRF